MRYAWLIVLAVVATTGCNQAELKKALAEAKTAEAQKDSLLTEVLETTQFVTDINSELAKAKSMSVKSASTDPGVPGAKKDREERHGRAGAGQAGHRPAEREREPSWRRRSRAPSSPGSGTRACWRRSRPSRRRSRT